MLAPLRAGRSRRAGRPAPRELRGPGRRGGPLAALQVRPEGVSRPGSGAPGGRAAAAVPIGPGSCPSARAPPRSAPAGRKRCTSARHPGRSGSAVQGGGAALGGAGAAPGRVRKARPGWRGPGRALGSSPLSAGLGCVRRPGPRSRGQRPCVPVGSLTAGGRVADASVRGAVFSAVGLHGRAPRHPARRCPRAVRREPLRPGAAPCPATPRPLGRARLGGTTRVSPHSHAAPSVQGASPGRLCWTVSSSLSVAGSNKHARCANGLRYLLGGFHKCQLFLQMALALFQRDGWCPLFRVTDLRAGTASSQSFTLRCLT